MKTENTIIEDQEQGLKGWWNRNKKTVYIVGGVIIAVGIGYALFRNFDAIRGVFTAIKPEGIVNKAQINAKIKTPVIDVHPETTESISKIINGGEAFDVSGHIRTLPSGWKASQEKIAEAAKLGITLMEKQTLVDSYIKNTA